MASLLTSPPFQTCARWCVCVPFLFKLNLEIIVVMSNGIDKSQIGEDK